jgi:hypothetical protein
MLPAQISQMIPSCGSQKASPPKTTNTKSSPERHAKHPTQRQTLCGNDATNPGKQLLCMPNRSPGERKVMARKQIASHHSRRFRE